jgi:hypothetical protein
MIATLDSRTRDGEGHMYNAAETTRMHNGHETKKRVLEGRKGLVSGWRVGYSLLRTDSYAVTTTILPYVRLADCHCTTQ